MKCGITIRHLALPFLGTDAANRIGAAIRASLKISHVPVLAVILPIVAGTGLAAMTVRERRLGPDFWLLASDVLIAAASYMGEIGGVATLLGVVQSEER